MLLIYDVGDKRIKMDKKKILEALGKLRKETKERKFEQTIDLVINLKKFDAKKESINLFLELPNKVKDAKIAGFLNKKSGSVESILKQDFGKYKEKKMLKNLIKKYDFFISAASLMPQVATVFGRFLGPAGKMPSPQLGILKQETEKEVQDVVKKFEKIIRIKSKEPSLKFSIAKEKMKDEEIVENILTAYNTILNNLPRKKENIKNIMIKFTMSKPEKLEI